MLQGMTASQVLMLLLQLLLLLLPLPDSADTEGSFMTDRLIDMATAAVQQVRQQAAAAAQGAVNAAQQAAVTAQVGQV